MKKVHVKKIGQFLREFRSFIEKGSALDMAVGIIVGAAMTGVVNSLVKDVIMPPIGILMGGIDFSQFFMVLIPVTDGSYIYNTAEAAQTAGASTLNIGLFINSLISFLITMFAIFVLIHIVNKARDAAAKSIKDCPYCCSKIHIKAVKCPNCCSSLGDEDKSGKLKKVPTRKK